jgi:type IV pilus assembly protein PilV
MIGRRTPSHIGLGSRTGGSCDRRSAAGFAMLEVLVALVVATFGVMSLAVLQNRAISLELEANQRAQALVLLQDMTERISVNRASAGEYVAADIGVGAMQPCAAAGARSAFDLCEWGNLLRGSAAMLGTQGAGAMLGARGCISQPGPDTFLIEVAWQGLFDSAAPVSGCGAGQYGATNATRRTVTTMARFAILDAL